MLSIISLGLGVQSTALYYMSSMGMLPRTDHAIFADTGKEGSGTYRYLEFLLDWAEKNGGIPITVLREKDLYQDLLAVGESRRFVSIPSFTQNPDGTVGMLKRQCTYEYKIMVVDNYIRDHIYQLPKGAYRPMTAIWHGISLDEIERMHIPQEAWKISTYPFLGYSSHKHENVMPIDWGRRMHREEIVSWYLEMGLPVPPKSACVFCPYQSDRSWADRKKNHPEDFAAAVAVDRAIRDSTSKGINHPTFLHRSCVALDEVVFDEAMDEEFGECSGNCHI